MESSSLPSATEPLSPPPDSDSPRACDRSCGIRDNHSLPRRSMPPAPSPFRRPCRHLFRRNQFSQGTVHHLHSTDHLLGVLVTCQSGSGDKPSVPSWPSSASTITTFSSSSVLPSSGLQLLIEEHVERIILDVFSIPPSSFSEGHWYTGSGNCKPFHHPSIATPERTRPGLVSFRLLGGMLYR